MAEIDLSSVSALPIEERIKLAQAIWKTIPESGAEQPWTVTKPDAAWWADYFGVDALIYLRHVEARLPHDAHRFLQTCGLPKSIVLEGRDEQSISFAALAEPLVGYNSLIGWGIFFDSELDARMSEQLVIGQVDSAAGVASFCVEQQSGVVNLVNIAAAPPQTLVNSSVLQFAQSLQAAIEWSVQREEYRTLPIGFAGQLESRLRMIDADAFADRENHWPRMLRTIDDHQGHWRVIREAE